jgi:hypothetical protein
VKLMIIGEYAINPDLITFVELNAKAVDVIGEIGQVVGTSPAGVKSHFSGESEITFQTEADMKAGKEWVNSTTA